MKLPRGYRIRDWNWKPTCPGLRPGWFLLGDRETWYSERPCGERITLLRHMHANICFGCSAAHDRRGFRVNYQDLAGRTT